MKRLIDVLLLALFVLFVCAGVYGAINLFAASLGAAAAVAR